MERHVSCENGCLELTQLYGTFQCRCCYTTKDKLHVINRI